jgi:hypothetical protein
VTKRIITESGTGQCVTLGMEEKVFCKAQVMKLLIMQFSASFCHSNLVGPNISLNALFSDTLNMYFRIVRETGFHTHTKQQAKLKSSII